MITFNISTENDTDCCSIPESVSLKSALERCNEFFANGAKQVTVYRANETGAIIGDTFTIRKNSHDITEFTETHCAFEWTTNMRNHICGQLKDHEGDHICFAYSICRTTHAN